MNLQIFHNFFIDIVLFRVINIDFFKSSLSIYLYND